uniref:Uncharacterized protein n=1 Tax=Nelumbo nucifera TaxID=4432 RepID=A0A822ZWK5_NELNU|nr:TPA_asm: hypothetical protein HUJ06_017652 [Nelumbo nucifera]
MTEIKVTTIIEKEDQSEREPRVPSSSYNDVPKQLIERVDSNILCRIMQPLLGFGMRLSNKEKGGEQKQTIR